MKKPHKRVIEILRDRFDFDDSVTDEEVIKSTKGSIAVVGATSQHAAEELVKAFAVVGNSILGNSQ